MHNFRTKIINGVALITLLIAFYIGQTKTTDLDTILHSRLIKEQQVDSLATNSGTISAFRNGRLIGYVGSGKTQGYGGPLRVLLLSDTLGRTVDIDLCYNTETRSYLQKIRNNHFFFQFPGKKINDKYKINDDIVAVSGATISSNAIATASRHAAWQIARDIFKIKPPDLGSKSIIGTNEILVILIFIIAILGVFLNKKKIRYLAFFTSFILVGFILNASISFSHISRLILGYIPDLENHFIWWLLLFGNLIFIFFFGKNIYCNSICPFHATQILLNKISGINFKIKPEISRYIIKTPNFLLWICLVLVLISKNPTLTSYEPFAMFFSLEGIGLQWYILPCALIGSLFISDFFCHYFCPIGASFRNLMNIRQKLKNSIKKQNG